MSQRTELRLNEQNIKDPARATRQASDQAIHEESAKRELFWLGGIACAVLAVAGLAVIACSGPLQSGRPQGNTSVEVTQVRPSLAARTNCAEIGISDLRSPAEGLWFQSNCSPSVSTQSNQVSTNCNRSSLDDSFMPIAPGLFVSRLTAGSLGFLWYSQSEACFDLVSARVVTAVCVDQTVSFDWSARSGCSAHGGVLAWVNGR